METINKNGTAVNAKSKTVGPGKYHFEIGL